VTAISLDKEKEAGNEKEVKLDKDPDIQKKKESAKNLNPEVDGDHIETGFDEGVIKGTGSQSS